MIAVLVLAHLTRAANPCTLLDPQDIARILGWTVTTGSARSYRLAGGAGRMCTFEGRDGTVIVTVPVKGTGVTVNDQTSDLGTVRTPMHDAAGFDLPTELGRGCAIVHDRGTDYAITVQPIDAQFADEAQMRALVQALSTRVAHPRHA